MHASVKLPMLFFCLLLTGSCAGRTAERNLAGSFTISVVGTNDVHGAIMERDGGGGLALFGGYVANLRATRARDGGAVVLIDAGDMWQGTLESNMPEGAPVVAAYNVLGYNTVAIGNHEFDFGPVGPAAVTASGRDDPRGALKARASEANFPFLAANLLDAATGLPVSWPNVRPSQIIEVAGVLVGIIGITSENTLRTTLATNVLGLRLADPAGTVDAEARRLRAAGAKLVIVAAHAGGACARFDEPSDLSSCDPESEIFAVARALPKGLVDLIVGGHVHKGMAHEVNGIAIISSWSGGKFFGRVDFQIAGQHVTDRRIYAPTRICRYVDVDSGRCRRSPAGDDRVIASYAGHPVQSDLTVAKILAPALAAAATLKDERLGIFLETPFKRRLDPESPIGNLVTDIMLASDPRADVAIHNTLGGIRADLPAGDLTYGAVYEMFPFDNRMVRLSLSGAELRAVLSNQITGPVRRGNVSGIRVHAVCDEQALKLTILDKTGREIADEDRLLIISNDFLETGGDGVLTPIMPAGGFKTDSDGPLMRDIILEWMRNRGGHLSQDEFIDEANPRWTFPRPAPVHCR
jgi:5'-nucleotidase